MQVQRLSLAIFLTVIMELCNKLYPLLLFGLVIRRIGYEAFGQAQFGISLVELAVPLVTFGYHDYASIKVGRRQAEAS